jgi:hypothetical protein
LLWRSAFRRLTLTHLLKSQTELVCMDKYHKHKL